jgi:hypothetical protein
MVVPPQWATGRPSPPLELWHASTDHPVVVVVPERRFLAIGGAGHPGTLEFSVAADVLRNAADRVRAGIPRGRFGSPRTIVEVIWSIPTNLTVDEIVESFTHHGSHRWCQLIELPAGVADAAAAAAIDEGRRQAGRAEPLVRLMSLTEGLAVQILSTDGHGEAQSIMDLFRFLSESGFRIRGDLRQVVLADPDVVPRERARSIFRVPIDTA